MATPEYRALKFDCLFLRCKKFNHGEARCKYEQACINCGANHSDLFQEKPKCANCGGEHRADYRQCSQRIRESEFL